MLLSCIRQGTITTSRTNKLLWMQSGYFIRISKAHAGPGETKRMPEARAKLSSSEYSVLRKVKEKLAISRPWAQKRLVGRRLGGIALMGVLGPTAVACGKMIVTDEPATWEQFTRHLKQLNERIHKVLVNFNYCCFAFSIATIVYGFRSAFSSICSQTVRIKRMPQGSDFEVGQGVVTGATAFVLVLMACYGLNLADEATELSPLWPKYIKERIDSTYGYVGGFGAAAIVAGILFREAKLVSTEIGGSVLLKGTILTAGVVGGLSTIAISGPSEKLLSSEGLFGFVVGAVLMSSLASVIVPPATTIGSIFLAISVFGRWFCPFLALPAKPRNKET